MHHQLPEPTANPCWQQGLTQGLSPSGTVHEEAESGPQEEFHKHLYRLFGREAAEYFLTPPLRTAASPWVQRVLEEMGDQVSAEALWTVLREQSKLQLMKMDNEWTMNTQGQTGNKRAWNKQRMQQCQQVNMMYRTSQLYQDRTSLLLANKSFPDLNDSDGQEGPWRYLLPELAEVFQHMKHKRSSLDTSPGSIPARMESNTELLRFLKNKKQGNTEAQQKVWEGIAVGTITHPRQQRAVDFQHGVKEAAHLSMPATGKASKLLKEKKLAPQRLDGVART
ncbi:hypothetical protein HHUSO_G18339 [Huso huso]|uniref:Uncharacterized protein n=1 Tax=Huso huso TaxID=61971 RepID=A0ABR0Z6W2_HUSHU